MSSFARKLRRGSIQQDTITIGNNVYLISKRKSNGGNSKKTLARRRHPKGKWVVLDRILLTPNGVPANI